MKNKKVDISSLTIPKHIAFIMDGNGRWAKNRGQARKAGHIAGVDSLKKVLYRCNDLGVGVVSVFAFSTENWNRPKDEVDGLMKLTIKIFKKDVNEFIKKNVRITHMGDLDNIVPEKVKNAILTAEQKTKHCTGAVFNFAFNYGGRAEIVNAVNKIISEGKSAVTEQEFPNYLYTAGLPDPDLVVRTSGEQRVSNFMMWQMAYSEFYFIMDKHWPDMAAEDIDNLIVEFNKRERRFGAIKE